jgi:predicted nucleic acid-binding protein
MKKKIIVDTNILIYAFDENSIHHKVCYSLINSNENLYTTHNNQLEFYRVLTSKAFLKNYSIDLVKQALLFIKQRIIIVYPTEITEIILTDLVNQFTPKSGQIFDFLILAQTIENDLDVIYTYNISDFPSNLQISIAEPNL